MMSSEERQQEKNDELRRLILLQGRLMVAASAVVGLILDSDKALIPEDVYKAAEEYHALLSEHAMADEEEDEKYG